jgi:hypothetical protein
MMIPILCVDGLNQQPAQQLTYPERAQQRESPCVTARRPAPFEVGTPSVAEFKRSKRARRLPMP